MKVLRWLLIALAVMLLALLTLPWMIPATGIDGEIPPQPFADSRFVEIDGTRLHLRYREGQNPEAPLVILIHGFGGSSFSWRYSLDALESAGFSVIAVDLPPFGYSQRRSAGPDWPELVDRLAEQLAPGQPRALVGHSMGASVAARLQQRNPDQTDRVILVAGAPRMRQGQSRRAARLLGWPPVSQWLDIIAARTLVSEERIAESLGSAFGRAPTADEIHGYLHPLTIPGTNAALLARLDRERVGPLETWRPVNTWLIWGEEDAWVPIMVAERLLEQHPELPIARPPQVGHNPMDTHPERFNQLLLDHLTGGPGAGEPQSSKPSPDQVWD